MNGRLTVHLPLLVPPDCGAFAVAREARGWTEGECLAFDDSSCTRPGTAARTPAWC